MRRLIVLLFVLAACGDDSADFCGELLRVETPSGSYCACPEGTTETEEGCLLPDGGILPLPGPSQDGGTDGSVPAPEMTPLASVEELETGEWILTEAIVAVDGTRARVGDLGHEPREGADGHAAVRVRFERTERALIGWRATDGDDGPGPILRIPILEHLDAVATEEGWFVENARRPWDEHSHVRLDFGAISSEMSFGSVGEELRSETLGTDPPLDPTPKLRRFDCPGPETDTCSPLEMAQVGEFADGELVGMAGLRRATVGPCEESGCEGQLWIRTTLVRRPSESEYLPALAEEHDQAQLTTIDLAGC